MNVSPYGRMTAIGAAALLAACSSGMTKADCTGADWASIGLADGVSGARPKLFDQRTDDCAGHGFDPDIAAYSEARERGLASYCTPDGGFEAGRSGGEYQDVCPAGKEAAFLERFDQGVRLHALTLAKEKAAADYEAALADLDQHRYLLRVGEKRYAKPAISNEDRENERQEVEFRQREIVRIETDLPKMLADIEASRAALEGYTAELAAKGINF